MAKRTTSFSQRWRSARDRRRDAALIPAGTASGCQFRRQGSLVVMIAKVRSHSPEAGSFQFSHIRQARTDSRSASR